MKGFTLIEGAIVILLMILLFGIVINFNAFNKRFFYLRDQTKNFIFALNIISDLAQKVIEKNNNQFYCGYGIYFPERTRFENRSGYEVLAFATGTKLCEDVATSTALSNFISENLINKNYIHKNQEISTNTIPSLSLNNQLEENVFLKFGNNQNCNNLNPPLVFLYIYGYNELFFIAQQIGGNWQKLDINEIYVCLQKGAEVFKIKINRLGQVSQIQ